MSLAAEFPGAGEESIDKYSASLLSLHNPLRCVSDVMVGYKWL